jgi:hypothetical protein
LFHPGVESAAGYSEGKLVPVGRISSSAEKLFFVIPEPSGIEYAALKALFLRPRIAHAQSTSAAQWFVVLGISNFRGYFHGHGALKLAINVQQDRQERSGMQCNMNIPGYRIISFIVRSD